MKIFLRGAGLATSLLLLIARAGLAQAQPRTITEKDFLAFRWVADPRISPDGQSVAYVLVTVNEKGRTVTTRALDSCPPRAARSRAG